jgi:hypothetical protein
MLTLIEIVNTITQKTEVSFAGLTAKLMNRFGSEREIVEDKKKEYLHG